MFEYLRCPMDGTRSDTCCDQDQRTQCKGDASAGMHMCEEGGQV